MDAVKETIADVSSVRPSSERSLGLSFILSLISGYVNSAKG